MIMGQHIRFIMKIQMAYVAGQWVGMFQQMQLSLLEREDPILLRSPVCR